MLKKLFAAAICGVVIASISTHADAAGPGGFARSFATVERNAVASVTPLSDAAKIGIAKQDAIATLDQYLSDFDQTQSAK